MDWGLGVNSMQRLSALVRYIFTAILVPILIAVATHLIEEQPQRTANVVLKFLLDLSEQTWFRPTAISLGCFVAGLWVDWLLWRLDRSRADERKALGIEMLTLGRNLGHFVGRINGDPMSAFRPQITSCLTKVKRFGMWVPDDRIFSIHSPYAMDLIVDYLTQVGQMLQGENFREAKRDAKKSKAAFDKAYAEHRLPST